MAARDEDRWFVEWLVSHPPPDLQGLAEAWGGLGLVPEDVLQKFEREREAWLRAYHARPSW